MRSKQGRLWAYNLALLAVTALLASFAWPWLAQWPSLWLVLGFVLFQLLVWNYGFPVPSMGMISMERVPQIAAILLFPVEVAAVINAVPALLWPFLNRHYRQGSWHFGLVRALHNSCMVALMTVAGGVVYSWAGGTLPLTVLSLTGLLAVLAAALVMQLVNMSMMVLFLLVDGRDVRRLVDRAYLVVDMLFVPIGLLAALVWSQSDSLTFGLFVGFVVLTVVSLHEIVDSRRTIQHRVEALDAASSARQALSGSRRIEELAERLISQIGALFDYRVAFVALHDAARGEFDVVLQISDGERLAPFSRPVGQGAAGYVLKTGQPLLIDDWRHAPQEVREVAVLDPGEQPGSFMMIPIAQNGDVLGLVSVQHDSPHRYSEADQYALVAIAQDLAPLLADARTFEELDAYRERLERLVDERTAELQGAATERERLLAELRAQGELLQRQSREDVLTGLSNRRHFDECILSEIGRAQRYGHDLSLALIDIDHFKRFNDLGGHALGDDVLRCLGAMLRGHFRIADLVARIGGEEFAVLLPQTRLDGAFASLEQLREKVELDGPDKLSAGLPISISVGLAQLRGGETRDALMRRADLRLFAAKSAGRNRVLGEDADTPHEPR